MTRSLLKLTIFTSIVIPMLLIISTSVGAYQPPKKLTWKMQKDIVVDKIQTTDGLKIKDKHHKKPIKWIREYTEFSLPEGYFRAEIGGAKLFKKKAKKTYVIFDKDRELTSFQYVMEWTNSDNNKGMRKSWVFHSDLKATLLRKYNEPIEDETHESIRATDMPSGTKYRTRWIDEDGTSISLIITRQTHDILVGTIDNFYVFLIYDRQLDTVLQAPNGNDIDAEDDI